MNRRRFLYNLGLMTSGIYLSGCSSAVRNFSENDGRTVVYQSGEGGYDTYRIPSLLKTNENTLLAFCEGRKNSRSDTGNIDLLCKRSDDFGKTWSEQQVIWNDGQNVCGNPCVVQDSDTGTIHLLLTHNLGTDSEREIIHHTAESTRTVWICSSSDDGRSWSEPAEITESVKPISWGWYATGPGVGIQLREGEYAGRLVIPCDHSYDDPQGDIRGGPYGYGSHVIFSDDHGETWQTGGVVRPKVNECQVVELSHGTLLLNMRSYHGEGYRMHAWSYDGGINWTDPVPAPDLVEPVCQASLIRTDTPESGSDVLLFSNPAHSENRVRMTVKLSRDGGESWPLQKLLHPGPSAYSCLTMLTEDTAACLYEMGENHPYETITFESVILKSLKMTV
ncbi:MAG: exo-alpha-sialidase [Candidatus Marinimicrobia bacterium]|nr:exo-alpha-sialidase [Candidatus Neomarinimicrobiota bacterium]